MLMAWTSAVLEVVQPLGVLKYGALLCRVGWERATSSGRSFDGTRSSLPDLERRTRMSEFAHVVLGALGTGMVVVALACHAWDAAAWLFAANVVLHAYPIMLQRVLRARLHRLLQSATWRCVVRWVKTGCCATGSPGDLRRPRSHREHLFIDRVKRFTRKRGGSRARRVR